MPSATTAPAASSPSHHTSSVTTTPTRNAVAPPPATDDEILGIASQRKNPRDLRQLEFDFDAAHTVDNANGSRTAGVPPAPLTSAQENNSTVPADPAHLRAAFESNPDLRAAWHDAHAYRESFATPEAAREATALVADLSHMDALFFSRRPEDHAALARTVASLDPAAFASLARAMNEIATESQRHGAPAGNQGTTEAGNYSRAESSESVGARHAVPERDAWQRANSNEYAEAAGVPGGRSFSSDITARADRETALPQAVAEAAQPPQRQSSSAAQSSPAAQSATNPDSQLAFLHSANAAAVEGVIGAIESQVERLLPEGVAKNARTRVVGEIYRELDSTLRSNPQFAAQLRDAFRSGSLDDAHHRAIVSLLTGRARQALPAVAKRVLNEWTSTIVTAANECRTRQRTAERRIDIAGSGGASSDGRRAMSPRDLDYTRLTDADILNL